MNSEWRWWWRWFALWNRNKGRWPVYTIRQGHLRHFHIGPYAFRIGNSTDWWNRPKHPTPCKRCAA